MNDSEPQPVNQLSLWDAVSIIVGIVIGTTIYKLPWLIFSNAYDPWTSLIVWGLGGILALIGAFCYAELATTYPRSGGDYVYLTRSFGPWCGFLFGWAQLAVVLTASIAAMGFVFGEAATSLYKLDFLSDDVYQKTGVNSELIYAALAVGLLSVLNVVGMTMGKIAQNLLTVAKIVGLGAIIVAGFSSIQSYPSEWRFAETRPSSGFGPLALILVMYAFGGWNDAAFVAAEVRDVRRNLPRALFIGVGLITFIYLLINLAYLMGLGYSTAKEPGLLPAVLLERAFPDFGGKAMTILIMISSLGAVNGLIFTGARVYATLGNDYKLFAWLGHWKPGRSVPTIALFVQALITLGMLYLFGTKNGYHLGNDVLRGFGISVDEQHLSAHDAFDNLVSHTAPVFWMFFLMTGFSLFILRGVDPNLPRPFTVPFYPLLPFVFCVTCFFMLYSAYAYVGNRALLAFGLTALGLPLYGLSRLFGYRKDSLPPDETQAEPDATSMPLLRE